MWRLPVLGFLQLLLQGAMGQGPADTTAAAGDAWGGAWAAPPAAQHHLDLRMEAMFDASDLRNELVLGIWRGDRLGRELRQRSAGTRASGGRAGQVLEATATFSWGERLAGHRDLRPRVMAGHRDMLGIAYSKDLYQVTFFGNGAYENDIARLGPARAVRMQYQTIGIGLEHRDRRSFVVLQWVNGRRLNTVDVERADLFTATDGRYLLLDLQGRYSASDTTNGGRGLRHGSGAAVSGAFSRVVAWLPGRADATIGVDDLGFIAWDRNTLHVEGDSLIRYDGLRVDDVLDLDGTLAGTAGLQDSLGLGYRAGGRVKPLPGRLYGRLEWWPRSHWGLTAAVEQRYLPGFLPRASAMVLHNWGPRGRVAVSVAWGGFGGWRPGALYMRVLKPGLVLRCEVPNLTGPLGGGMRGLAAAVGLAWNW